MKKLHNIERYKRLEKFKPLAVRQYRDDNDQSRYAWGEDKKTVEYYADEPVWLPALADDYTHISLGGGLLMKKEQAEFEAKLMAKHLGKALQNDKA